MYMYELMMPDIREMMFRNIQSTHGVDSKTLMITSALASYDSSWCRKEHQLILEASLDFLSAYRALRRASS